MLEIFEGRQLTFGMVMHNYMHNSRLDNQLRELMLDVLVVLYLVHSRGDAGLAS